MAKLQKLSWQERCYVIGIVPGIILHPIMGEIDLSLADLSDSIIDSLLAENCPYLKLKENL